MKPNQVLPELVMATLSVSLWFTPKNLLIADVDISKLIKASGLATSTVLYAKSYLILVCNWSKFQSEEHKEEIQESIDLELFEYERASQLAIKKLEIDKKVLEATVPIANAMHDVEAKQHPEISEQERFNAAKNAIESAIAPTLVETLPPTQINDETIRKKFPENLDSTYWKAVLSNLQKGFTKDEIVQQVLGCNGVEQELGKAYFELLKSKFC
jgi:hypothetical protein